MLHRRPDFKSTENFNTKKRFADYARFFLLRRREKPQHVNKKRVSLSLKIQWAQKRQHSAQMQGLFRFISGVIVNCTWSYYAANIKQKVCGRYLDGAFISGACLPPPRFNSLLCQKFANCVISINFMVHLTA